MSRIMKDVIHLTIEYIHPGRFDEDTIPSAMDVIRSRFPSSLRIDFDKTERRGHSMVVIAIVWIDDPDNCDSEIAESKGVRR